MDIIVDGQRTQLYSGPGGLVSSSSAGSEAAVESRILFDLLGEVAQFMMFHVCADFCQKCCGLVCFEEGVRVKRRPGFQSLVALQVKSAFVSPLDSVFLR